MGKTLKDNKVRNYHAINAWNRVSAGPMKDRRSKRWKQNWRVMIEDDLSDARVRTEEEEQAILDKYCNEMDGDDEE